MEGVGGCPKFIVLSTGPLSVPNYYTIITQGLYWEVRTVRMHLLLHIRPFTSYFYLFFFTFTLILFTFTFYSLLSPFTSKSK